MDYIPDLVHDLSLLAVKYEFDSKSENVAVDAAHRFKRELKDVDRSLMNQGAAELIPGKVPKNIGLPKTMQLIPVEDFISTVCF